MRLALSAPPNFIYFWVLHDSNDVPYADQRQVPLGELLLSSRGASRGVVKLLPSREGWKENVVIHKRELKSRQCLNICPQAWSLFSLTSGTQIFPFECVAVPVVILSRTFRCAAQVLRGEIHFAKRSSCYMLSSFSSSRLGAAVVEVKVELLLLVLSAATDISTAELCICIVCPFVTAVALL